MADTETAPDRAIEPANNKRSADSIIDPAPETEPKRAATGDSDETIQIKVQFGKLMKVVERSLDTTVADLKKEIEEQEIESSEKGRKPSNLVHKEEIVKKWLEQTKPLSVVDLGANTGRFSFLAASYTKRVVALESDDICVDIMERQIKKQKLTHVNVLMQELAETSPQLGVNEKEVSSIFTRAKSEMVMALAIEHHLHLTNLISLSQIAEMFSLFSSKYLITEFIPANDSKVQLLIKNRNKDLSAYTIEAYKTALEKYFNIIEETKLDGSERILILLQKL